MNNDLPCDELDILKHALAPFRKSLGYSIDDIKGIHPSLCMHRIHMEEGFKPTIEPQRRLNPNMKEVVRKEVIKLLDAGIIYSNFDSKWVSLV